MTLTADNRCVYDRARGWSGCSATLPHRAYCSRCNAAGTACLRCAPGRSLEGGVCGLQHKLLFGISCGSATRKSGCTRVDPAFAAGR